MTWPDSPESVDRSCPADDFIQLNPIHLIAQQKSLQPIDPRNQINLALYRTPGTQDKHLSVADKAEKWRDLI